MTLYQLDVLQFSQNGGPIPGVARRADRSLIVGISLSLALHALVILTFFVFAAQQGTPASTTQRGGPAVTVVFLTGSAAASQMPLRESPEPIAEAGTTVAAGNPRSPAATVTGAASVPSPSRAAGAAEGNAAAAAPAVALAAPVTNPVLGDDYRRRLQSHIAGFRRLLSSSVGGLVQVRLAISRQGDVLAVEVASSSGDTELDDEAVATIWRARPMRIIPDTLPARLVVTLPVSFDQKRPVAIGSTRP